MVRDVEYGHRTSNELFENTWQASYQDDMIRNVGNAFHTTNILCGPGDHIGPIMRTVGHYNDVIISVMASQTTSLTIVYSTVYSVADQRKHQSSATLAYVRGIHR